MAPIAQWLGGRAPGSERSWVQSSPCVIERVTGQTIQSLWRISSSTSGANTSSNGTLLESKQQIVVWEVALGLLLLLALALVDERSGDPPPMYNNTPTNESTDT